VAVAWAAPEVGDIVWCIVPYVDHAGRTSQVRHPALILAVDAHLKAVQVAVVGGASERGKRARKSTDLLIQTTDVWFKETGLVNDTVFHFERRYHLPYTPAHFVASVGGTPKLGALSAKHPELVDRLRRALRAAH
jgi:hypothetical protein